MVQLSPVEQIQILEDIITTQQQGLQSIDFMDLLFLSHTIIFLICLNTTEEVTEKCGLVNRVGPNMLGKFVQGPVILSDCLTGNPSKDEEALKCMVYHVKISIVEGTERLHSLGEDSEDGSWADTDEE